MVNPQFDEAAKTYWGHIHLKTAMARADYGAALLYKITKISITMGSDHGSDCYHGVQGKLCYDNNA